MVIDSNSGDEFYSCEIGAEQHECIKYSPGKNIKLCCCIAITKSSLSHVTRTRANNGLINALIDKPWSIFGHNFCKFIFRWEVFGGWLSWQLHLYIHRQRGWKAVQKTWQTWGELNHLFNTRGWLNSFVYHASPKCLRNEVRHWEV